MIGKRAEEVLNRAVRYAFDRRHEYFTLEHVLLSLLEEDKIVDILLACRADLGQLRTDLNDFLSKDIPSAPGLNKNSDGISSGDGDSSEGDERLEHPIATLSIQRLIQRALFHVQSAGKDEIQPEDLLVALFQCKDSQALFMLQKQKVDRLNVVEYISHGVPKDSSSGEAKTLSGNDADKVNFEHLEKFTTNLNQEARLGKIDPLVGRSDELDRLIQTLCRRRKNNPLLVGEAGVGKTAIAEGLALRIVQGEIPLLLKNSEVFSLDLGSLLAGAKFRGDFEQRLKKVLQELRKKKDKGVNAILLIDEIHTLIGAGSVSGGAMDAANLLKPILTRGELQIIGSTTYQEYRSIFEKDHALARRFQKIDVPEPSQSEAIQILKGLKSKFEEHHQVEYTEDAIQAAVQLSVKHITDRFLPDKAIDVVDEAGARARLERSKAGADEHENHSEKVKITEKEIEEIVSKIARIPPRSVNSNQKDRLKKLDRDLKLSIFGQDHAIDSIVTAIKLSRSGLRSGDKPVGSFLFCGPTGVGKTELSKQLALVLGVPFLRFDMSEYMEKHTVSRLIGAPPGYVGFEQAGLLTEAALKNPHSVILLDEIEKAHADVWNILLQVMDHGTLTDNNGKKADFRNVVLILTSNVGSRELERRSLGLSDGGSTEATSKKEVERTFSPEFRNRLDATVFFNPLNSQTILQVVAKQISELESQLLAKGVDLEVESEVKDWLGRKGYDRFLGARPMGRLIQEKIKRPLSEEILFGKLEKGGRVRVSLKGEEPHQELVFDVTSSEKRSEESPVESETVHSEE